MTLCTHAPMMPPSLIQGGESTSDEMCQALLLYYPKIDLANCGTYPDPDSAHRGFFKKYYQYVHTDSVCVTCEYDFSLFCSGVTRYINQALNSLRYFDRVGIQQSFDWVTWTDTAVKDLQDGINNAKREREYCTTDVNLIDI